MIAVDLDVVGDHTSYVASDNIGGARLAVRHLHGLGHTRIAYIAGPRNTKPGADRTLGYRAEMRELGLKIPPGYEIEGRLLPGERRAGDAVAARAGGAPDRRVRGRRHDGRRARSRAMHAAGLSVPGDLAIVGFDDIRLAELLSPPLTTVRQDMVGIGLAAGRALVEQIENPDVDAAGADAAGRARRPGVLRRARERGSRRIRRWIERHTRRYPSSGNVFEQGGSAVKRIHAGRRWQVLAVTGGLIAAVAIGLVATTASAKSPATTSRSRVSLFGDFGYHDLYKQYEAAHPGVTIKEVIQSYADHHTQLAQHLATGAGAADVEAIEVGFIPQFTAQPQNFVDLRKYGADAIKSRWLPWKYQQAVGKGGAVIGLGTDVGSLAICYRKDLFKKAGLPTNPRGRLEAVADVAGLHQHRASATRRRPRRARSSSTRARTSTTR